MENKFDLNNISYQDCIKIKEKETIINFYDSHIDYWKEDIIKFDSHYADFNIDNSTELVIQVSDYYDKKITFDLYFLLKDNSKIYLSIKSDDMINWLEKNNLIIK